MSSDITRPRIEKVMALVHKAWCTWDAPRFFMKIYGEEPADDIDDVSDHDEEARRSRELWSLWKKWKDAPLRWYAELKMEHRNQFLKAIWEIDREMRR